VKGSELDSAPGSWGGHNVLAPKYRSRPEVYVTELEFLKQPRPVVDPLQTDTLSQPQICTRSRATIESLLSVLGAYRSKNKHSKDTSTKPPKVCSYRAAVP
jgi:hypothetical protein